MNYSHLIGIPYEKMNCWDIAVKFYQDVFSLKLRQYYETIPENKNEICSLIKANEKDFVKVKSPEFGDLVSLKLFGVECHIAIYVGTGLILHTQKKTGSVIDKLSRWSNLVSGYYSIKKGK